MALVIAFIGTSIGVEDPVIGRLQLNEGGAGGRLYVERLAAALAVHLLRSSGLSRRSPIQHKGGLAPGQIRRVLEYIEAHLTEELGLVELAAIVEPSPHYFGEAFRISTGRSPHRYVMERRVEWARDLLKTRIGRSSISLMPRASRARAISRRTSAE